jgi:DNA-binding transcriptional MerR regulator
MDTFKLDELAQAAGTSPRTVRYYVQRGLLPAPAFRGKDSAYSREHLVRLRAIRHLQDRHLPLDAIQVELARLGPADLERLAEGKLVVKEPLLPPSVPPGPPSAGPPVSGTLTRWSRRELLPGLELTVADDASPEARALAEELRSFCDAWTRKRGNLR